MGFNFGSRIVHISKPISENTGVNKVAESFASKPEYQQYALLKGTLSNPKTPQHAKDDFVKRTFVQLRVEAIRSYRKHGDKEVACRELLKEITSDAKYMEILAIVKIDANILETKIKEVLSASS